jgi:hypothetical protein
LGGELARTDLGGPLWALPRQHKTSPRDMERSRTGNSFQAIELISPDLAPRILSLASRINTDGRGLGKLVWVMLSLGDA